MIKTGTYLADRYEILETVGQGGMSRVYKARDHVLGRNVAVKVLKSEYAEDTTFVTKFRAEAQAAAGLEHTNIVNIYDVGSENGIYYIVMELVEGSTLKDYIDRKGRLNYKEMISITIQAGRGIEAAHQKGIIHRDIKPHNIMVSNDGKVKVTDFGIAKAVSSNTRNADMMGSVHYTSPEQARGGYVTYQSDIYSLGIVMYEMATGRVPYDGDSTVAIALQHLQGTLEPPSTYAPDLPIALEEIILKATQKSPDRRYAGMEEMLADLRKALSSPDESILSPAGISEENQTRVVSEAELDRIRRDHGILPESESEENRTSKSPGADDEEEEDEETDAFPIQSRKGRAGAGALDAERWITIGGIAAAIVLVLIAGYLLLRLSGFFRPGSDADTGSGTEQGTQQETPEDEEVVEKLVAVPQLVGSTQDDALAVLADAGLSAELASATSGLYPEGTVCEQSIAAGEEVTEGTVVRITVSAGEELIPVPSVSGLAEDSAYNTLMDSGFSVRREYEYNNDVAEGNVIYTSPEGGAGARRGDLVVLHISQGRQTIQVPGLANLTEQEAADSLTAAGLSAGNISRAYSESVEAGRVVSQGISEGQFVDPGTAVDLVISQGPEVVLYFWDRTLYSKENAQTTYILYDGGGNSITSWTIAAGTSKTVHVNQLTTPSGTLCWEYQVEVEVTDETPSSETSGSDSTGGGGSAGDETGAAETEPAQTTPSTHIELETRTGEEAVTFLRQ